MSKEQEELIRKIVNEELDKRNTLFAKAVKYLGYSSLVTLVGALIMPGVIPSNEAIVLAVRQVVIEHVEEQANAPIKSEDSDFPDETPVPISPSPNFVDYDDDEESESLSESESS